MTEHGQTWTKSMSSHLWFTVAAIKTQATSPAPFREQTQQLCLEAFTSDLSTLKDSRWAFSSGTAGIWHMYLTCHVSGDDHATVLVFSAMIQNPTEKSKMHSVEGTSMMLTSGPAYTSTSSLQYLVHVVYVLERQQDVTQTLQKSNIAVYTPFLHVDKSKVCGTVLANSQFGE